MKLQASLAAALFAIASAFTLDAVAASEQAAGTGAPKAEQKEQAKTCPCMEEKAGTASHQHEAQPAQDAQAKVNPMFDRSKHYHPRDGGKL